MSDFPKHSMNSLRSNSISYFVPQIAFRNPRLNIVSENPTHSKDLLVRNVFEELRDEKTWSMKCGNRLCRFACRSAPAMLAWLVQECFRGATRRQAFSVVGIKETWRTLSVSEGQRLESHTKTLMERASSRNQLSPLPKIGEGFGEWSEAPSYKEGVGVDGGPQGSALQKKVR